MLFPKDMLSIKTSKPKLLKHYLGIQYMIIESRNKNKIFRISQEKSLSIIFLSKRYAKYKNK